MSELQNYLTEAGGEKTHPPYIRIIRELRVKAGLTQQDMAEILGTSQTMYARYERGANELPVRHLITLTKVFRVTAGEILGLEARENAAAAEGSCGSAQDDNAAPQEGEYRLP